jgi:glycerate kinase
VLTGEGRYDATSLDGKVVGHVLGEARAAGVPAAIVAGDAAVDALEALPPDVSCVTLASIAGSAERAVHDAARLAADAAELLARG